MRKTFWVAWREFTSTVATKTFIFVICMPILIGAVAGVLIPLLMNAASPKVNGRIAVIDRSGVVLPRLEKSFSPEAMKARRDRNKKDVADEVEKRAPGMGKQLQNAPDFSGGMKLTLEVLPKDADLEAEKAVILRTDGKEKEGSGENSRLGLAFIPEGAVKRSGSALFEDYQLFIAPKLDIEVQADVKAQIARAIIDSRIHESGLDVETIRALTQDIRVKAVSVTKEGEKKTSEVAQVLLPGVFLMLMWMSVFTAGQNLLTSTIEEKSNRVMEVLLSAVSPMQLMVGKIVGQMAVASLILLVYGSLGIGSLIFFSLRHLVDPMMLVYLVIYFVIAFSLVACMMAAVGSAVSDVREAQSLLTPVMLILTLPMMLWFPLMRNPNSMFAQVVSFIPPVSPFVMTLRLAGSEKVPTWQIPATMLLGILSMLIFAWAAAKIFRIGVLMYGKPPNFMTLLRWIRMA